MRVVVDLVLMMLWDVKGGLDAERVGEQGRERGFVHKIIHLKRGNRKKKKKFHVRDGCGMVVGGKGDGHCTKILFFSCVFVACG